jgi:hypothetical protein
LTTLEIIFGMISSIGAIIGIYYTIKNNKKPNTNNVLLNTEKEYIQNNNLNFKSDKDIRDYIDEEMKNSSLLDVSFENLSKKFIGLTVLLTVKVEKVEKINDEKCKIYFSSSSFSRLEYAIVNQELFPIINFIKKNEKYEIEGKINQITEISLVIDNITLLNKL